jgi:hypothetical protein
MMKHTLSAVGRMTACAGVGLLALTLCSVPAFAKPGGGKGGGGKGGGDSTGSEGTNSYQSELRQKWRATLNAPFSMVRPAVDPGLGVVYMVDALDNLYAFDASMPAGEKTPLWVIEGAGSKGVDVGADGTVYTGNEYAIKAYYPDGSLKWAYDIGYSNLTDVALSPAKSDNGYPVVCAAASDGVGAICLEDKGKSGGVGLLWSDVEGGEGIAIKNPRYYTEIAFGIGVDDQYQMYFADGAHTHAYKVNTSTATQVFRVPDVGEPVVSPYDGSWHVGNAAYTSTGDLIWKTDKVVGDMLSVIGADGTHFVNQGSWQYAIDSYGGVRWSTDLGESLLSPSVDQDRNQLLIPTDPRFGETAAIRAVSTGNGQKLWRSQLQAPESGVSLYVDAGLALNGDTAYVVTTDRKGATYLHALSTDPSIPNASTVLRSASIDLTGRLKGGKVSMSGSVSITDENQAAISGATVTATWTLPDGSTSSQTVTSGGSGVAKFSVSGGRGFYTLTVTDISSSTEAYGFDAEHGVLSATDYRF